MCMILQQFSYILKCSPCLHWSFLFCLFIVNVQVLIKLLFNHSFFPFLPPATPVPFSKSSNAPPQLYSLIFVFIAKYCHSAKSLSCNVCGHHRKGILELGYYILSYQASQYCTVQTPIQSYFNMSTIFILN